MFDMRFKANQLQNPPMLTSTNAMSMVDETIPRPPQPRSGDEDDSPARRVEFDNPNSDADSPVSSCGRDNNSAGSNGGDNSADKSSSAESSGHRFKKLG